MSSRSARVSSTRVCPGLTFALIPAHPCTQDINMINSMQKRRKKKKNTKKKTRKKENNKKEKKKEHERKRKRKRENERK